MRARFLLFVSEVILWAIEFEIAFTPQWAKAYTQLKEDRIYWHGEVLKYSLISNGGIT